MQAAEYLNGPVADPAPFAEIYGELSRSGSPHVRLVGIIGRIKMQQAARALREVDEELRRNMMEHRLAGRPPDPRLAEQANARASEVTAAFLLDAQSRLSPGAWRQLQQAIARRAREMVQVSFPAPPGRLCGVAPFPYWT